MKKLIAGSRFITVALLGTMAAATVTMVGCATKPTYQSANQAGPKIITNNQGVPNYHRVQRGDTVSQVAARYNLNYRQIGSLNGLDSKYTIYSGQTNQVGLEFQVRLNGNPIDPRAVLGR